MRAIHQVQNIGTSYSSSPADVVGGTDLSFRLFPCLLIRWEAVLEGTALFRAFKLPLQVCQHKLFSKCHFLKKILFDEEYVLARWPHEHRSTFVRKWRMMYKINEFFWALEKYRKEPSDPRSFQWGSSLCCVLLFLRKMPEGLWCRKAFSYHWCPCNPSLWSPVLAAAAPAFSQTLLLSSHLPTFPPAWCPFQLSSSDSWSQPPVPADRAWQMGCVAWKPLILSGESCRLGLTGGMECLINYVAPRKYIPHLIFIG